MGFFDRLFGRKKTGKKTEKKAVKAAPKAIPKTTPKKAAEVKQNYFFTNSNDFGLGEIQLGITGKMRVDGLLAIAEMEKIAKSRGVDFAFNVMYTSLLEEGALTVPVVCKIGEENFSIYFIYKEEELLKYKDLVNHISRTAYPTLIYFSSIPIYEGYQPKAIIEPFQLADLRHDKNGKVAGRFAMWWSSEEETQFHTSKTYEYLSKTVELMRGYETYVLGYVLRQTRITQEMELKRMSLPEGHATFIIDAPEEKKVLLDVSQEKGIRFLFPIQDTTKEYRERFLKGAMVDIAATTIPLQQHKLPKDEELDPNSYNWFTFMSRVITEKEKSGEMKGHQIGLIEYNTEMN